MRRLLWGGLAALWMQGMGAIAVNAQTPADILPSRRPQGTGNLLTYPPGTQIYRNGGIQTPDGQMIYPSVAVPKGDGSTTYYYANGTRIDLNQQSVNPGGTYLIPGRVNGGLGSNSSIRVYQPPTFPSNPDPPNFLDQLRLERRQLHF